MELVAAEDVTALGMMLAAAIQRGLGPRSKWALNSTLGAISADGVDGECRIIIPAKTNGQLEVEFITPRRKGQY